MSYSFFLFSKLFEAVHGVSDEEYDLLYERIKGAFDEYADSRFNNPQRNEYDCILDFLNQ